MGRRVGKSLSVVLLLMCFLCGCTVRKVDERSESIGETDDKVALSDADLAAGGQNCSVGANESESLVLFCRDTITIEGRVYSLKDALDNALSTDRGTFPLSEPDYIRFLRDVITDDIYYIYVSYPNGGCVLYSIVDGPILTQSGKGLLSGRYSDPNTVYYNVLNAGYRLNDDGTLTELYTSTGDSEKVSLEYVLNSMEGVSTTVHDENGNLIWMRYERDANGRIVRNRYDEYPKSE